MKRVFTLDEINEAASGFKDSPLAKQKYARVKQIFERDNEKLEKFIFNNVSYK